MKLNAIRKKAVRYAIGLTAGSSCAGINAALVRLKGTGPQLHIKPMHFQHFPFPPGFRARLLMTRKEPSELALLNFEIGDRLAEASTALIAKAHEELCEVDFVAMQGHVAAHIPPRGGFRRLGALCVGEPSVVAEKTDLPVISDFRARDMAAGGQGGPLTAYADWLLFSRPDRVVVRLHLGSVFSLTVVTPDLEHLVAFDTGPGNLAIDGAVRLLTSGTQEVDKKGAMAAKGVLVDEFLDYLLDQPYFGKVPPKTTGREEFGEDGYLRDALMARKDHKLDDLVATVTAAAAYSVVRAYNRFVKPQHPVARVIVSGGSVANKTLLNFLRKGLEGVVLRTTDEYGLPHAGTDAIAIAILGNETLCGHPSNVPQATGASKPVLMGRITPA